jgi:radical SAM protein with 4Fe4S-binding SPASM domain
MKLNKSSKVVFNHFYKFRHDLKRTIIYSSDNAKKANGIEVNSSWISKIHPVYAMLFSFLWEPISLVHLYREIAYFFEIDNDKAKKLITPFLNQKEPFYVEYNGDINQFPMNIIVDASKPFPQITRYVPEQFVYEEIDLSQERFYVAPLSAVFMVNNSCATDCVYCYADKSVKTKNISFDRLKEIIKNARELGLNSFMPTGGEFFLYKDWKKIVDLFAQYEYNIGLISTKIPIEEDHIRTVKLHNIKIQISLDAVEDDILAKVLNINNGYAGKMKKTVRLLDTYEVPFQISTVLTNYNATIINLENIYEFLKDCKNIQRWEIRLAFHSLYSRGNFDKIKVAKEDIDTINKWITVVTREGKLNIQWDITGIDRYFKSDSGSTGFIGSRCSANYSNILILPDGKVTLCEQLYWHPEYIIGDLTNQSIEEVWNSHRALELAFPQKKHFRDKSVCKHCNIFEECYAYPNRCIVDVLKGYGRENSDYPDPRCIKAPPFVNELRY